MSMSIKGIIHIHSLYSYDGIKSMEEIKKTFKDIGVNFIIFTEHIEKLNDFEMTSFISECKSLSENDFIIIPGFEFKCENIEILGLNISKNFKYSGLEELISQIQKNGGLAILAHPHKYVINNSIFSSLEKLDGVEVWNLRYDGFSPRVNNIILLKKLRLNKNNIFAYVGLDYHNDLQNNEYIDRPNFLLTHLYAIYKRDIKKKIFPSTNLCHYMTVEKLSLEEIIRSLKKGEFYIGYKNIRYDSILNIKLYNYILFNLSSLEFDFLIELMKIEIKILHLLNRNKRYLV